MIQVLALAMLASPSPSPNPSPVEARIAERLRAFDGRMGVAAVHLDTGETIAVDADLRFPTASGIKTAVMVEAFHQIADGRLEKDRVLTLVESEKVGGSGVLHSLRAGAPLAVSDLLFLMIALSDNTATNMLVDRIGAKNVVDRMATYGLPSTRLYRATFRGGRPAVFPEEEREYGLGSSTPREMARLMETIARGKAVSRAASDEMFALLGKQQDRNMIPRRLPADAQWAGKSGTDEEKLADAAGFKGAIRTDAGIVTAPSGRYAIAIMARRVKDTRWTADNDALVTGAEVSRLVHDHFAGR
jgi:beta-lactamase class A